MNNPFTLLPATARKWVYVAYALGALIVGCVDIYYGTTGDPAWVGRTQDVIAYLAVPMGALAASNTPASTAEVIEEVEKQVAKNDEPPADPDRIF